MDTVRFGRVLGQGARHAAKTLVSAVDAATATNPGAPAATAARSTTPPPAPPPTILPPAASPQRPAAAGPSSTTSATATGARPAAATRGLAEGSRRFGRAVWTPAVRLSGVLWLELTGVFFGLFALVAAIAAWRLRFAVHAAPASDDRMRLLFAAGMILVFGYFSFSSFLKANRRSRQP